MRSHETTGNTREMGGKRFLIPSRSHSLARLIEVIAAVGVCVLLLVLAAAMLGMRFRKSLFWNKWEVLAVGRRENIFDPYLTPFAGFGCFFRCFDVSTGILCYHSRQLGVLYRFHNGVDLPLAIDATCRCDSLVWNPNTHATPSVRLLGAATRIPRQHC
jgi:hypothetical protein